MHFVYIDDSGDEKHRCFAALILHESAWKDAQLRIRNYRRELKRSDAMYVTKELHANEFVAGRGNVGLQVVPKGRRCQIFSQTLEIIASLPNIHLMNAFSSKANERVIFERLVNRINRAMAEWKSHAVIFHDEGKDFTRLIRRMCIYNPIRSRYGMWPGGSQYKNIPIDRILEGYSLSGFERIVVYSDG